MGYRTNWNRIGTFAGLPVLDYDPGQGLREAGESATRVRVEWSRDDPWPERQEFLEILTRFGRDRWVKKVPALVVGPWERGHAGGGGVDDSSPVVQALVRMRKRLPALRALFLGEYTPSECELTWIRHGDVSPLLKAYPNLEELWIRGSQGLTFGPGRHDRLKTLVVEAGALPGQVAHDLCGLGLPALEHLELWLGAGPDYGVGGRTVTVDDLRPILSGKLFPRLRVLGLRNCDLQDEVAAAVAASPILARLEVLDLGMGTLGDEGARALLASPGVRGLRRLELDHNWLSPELAAQLRELPIEVTGLDYSHFDEEQATNPWQEDQQRYVAIGE